MFWKISERTFEQTFGANLSRIMKNMSRRISLHLDLATCSKKVCHHCSRIVFFERFYKEWLLRKRPLLSKGTANSEFSHSQNLIYSDFINALVFQIPPEVWCFRYDFRGPNTSSPGALKPRDGSIMWDHVSSPDSWLSIPMVIFQWWWIQNGRIRKQKSTRKRNPINCG